VNPAIESILGRRSIRRFQDREVPDECVRTLLDAAMAAPSACCKDPWHFVVVRDRGILAKLAEGLPNGQMLASAGVGLAVCANIDAAHDRLISYALQDCSAAIENVLLAAHALGLGAVWLGVHPRKGRMAHLADLLDLPANILPIAAIAIGWPAEHKEPRTRYDETKVHHEKW